MSAPREPMWFCHECRAEMRPLMIPDPHCASCRGTFVEMMDDPSDDPRRDAFPLPFLASREDSHTESGTGARPVGGMPSILEALSNMLAHPRDQDLASADASVPRSGSHEPRGQHGSGSGLRLVINTPTGTRTVRLEGSNALGSGGAGRGGDRDAGAPLLSEFLASQGSSANADGNQPPQTRRAPAPLLASYLLSNLFARGAVGRDGHGGAGMFDPFELLAGGRFGDYVVNEQALQNIMNELMANGGAQQSDPPAPEEVISNLHRVVLEDGHPLANDSCSICHEPFNSALAASPDAFSSSSSSHDTKEDGPSMVGVTLPCNHTFHEDCILPWMRMKSTCPVCRKSVLPSAQASGSSPGPNSPSTSQGRPGGSWERGSRIPGAWDALD